MILYLDDQSLNKFVPLRKLAPYRANKNELQWKNNLAIKNLQKEYERKKKKNMIIS